MPIETIDSDFALSVSQTVSNSCKRIITFKPVATRSASFVDSLAKFRENSFFVVFHGDRGYGILGLDQAILGAWLNENLESIGEREFMALKDSTTALCMGVQGFIAARGVPGLTPQRWEIHPNFLAIARANEQISLSEFNVHIGRRTGKMWIVFSGRRSSEQ